MALVTGLVLAAEVVAAEPVEVCATTPELGSLVREVGGDLVDVTVFARPAEDPHFVEARPSFIKSLNEAEMYVQNGLELEAGWAPVLLQNARNPRVLPGATGYVDASVVVTPLQVPLAPIDRSMGDVHAQGNPHYLLDPLNGLRVAALLRDTLGVLRPEQRALFQQRYADLARRIHVGLVGEPLAEKYDAEKLALLFEHGKLDAFLERQGQAQMLGGWLGRLRAHRGAQAVDDHNLWVYFARRFGIEVIGHLEPKPGIPPTTRHLRELIEIMRADGVALVLASTYYDPRHADFVARETGAKVLRMANQVGARPGTDDYIATVDYNVRQVTDALGGGS